MKAAADTIRSALDAFNRHDVEAFAELFADDAIVEDPQYQEPLRGRDAIRKDMGDFMRALPDIHGELRTITEGNGLCAFEAIMTGTHTGPLATPGGDIPATGRPVAVGVAIFSRVDASGRIVEERRYYDQAALLTQLGVIDLSASVPAPTT